VEPRIFPARPARADVEDVQNNGQALSSPYVIGTSWSGAGLPSSRSHSLPSPSFGDGAL